MSATAGSSSPCPQTSHATISRVADQRAAPRAAQGVRHALTARDRGADHGAARVEEADGGQLRVHRLVERDAPAPGFDGRVELRAGPVDRDRAHRARRRRA
jgi:hypothetical protein